MHGPTVNINGTSREELIAQSKGVRDAAKQLRTALLEARPHGRDYQTVKEGAGVFATDQYIHDAMIGKVDFIDFVYSAIQERLVDGA